MKMVPREWNIRVRGIQASAIAVAEEEYQGIVDGSKRRVKIIVKTIKTKSVNRLGEGDDGRRLPN